MKRILKYFKTIDGEVTLVIFGTGLVIWSITSIALLSEMKGMWEKDAVDHGYAQYYDKPDGSRHWRWLNDKHK